MSAPSGTSITASLSSMPVAPPPRKKIVRRVLQKKIGGRLTAAASNAGGTNSNNSSNVAPPGSVPNGVNNSSSNLPSNSSSSIHRQQSSMAALLSSAHEEVEVGLEAPPMTQAFKRERRDRPLSPGSAMRRLAVMASYSPYAVSLPVLMSDLSGSDRFRDGSRSFWGVVLFCDISGFTKLAEALALGNEPAATSQQPISNAGGPPPRHPYSNYHSASASAASVAAASTAAASATSVSGQSDHRRWLQRAGADTLVTIINQIFHKIVSLIVAHHGDVIKFAGDALLSVWRPDPSDCADSSSEYAARQKCALIASKAALEISACMANFEAHGVKMSVHSGLAAGQLVELHLGGFKGRWEYLIAGQPILSMGRALDVSQGGDVVAHGSVWELIHDQATGVVLDQPPNSQLSLPIGSPKHAVSLPSPTAASLSLSTSTTSPSPSTQLARLISVNTTVALSNNFFDYLTNFCPARRERAQEALASYIPEPAMALMQSGKELIAGELRQVTILFISLPDFDYTSIEALRRNQSAVVIIQQVLYRFDGVMRQLIQDDKGTVCIVAFGLPYSTHEDDPLRGVLTAIVIKKNLETQLSMRCIIGVTTGDAYCGVVGNENRCEYAIVGDCVNLSARLMGHAAKLYNVHTIGTTPDDKTPSISPDAPIPSTISGAHGGILCDGDTESHISQGHDSSHGIHFQAQGRVPVKGRKHEVAIFTPLFTDQAQSIGKPDLLMFGRRKEMGLITSKMEALKEMHTGGVLVIEGEAGMGKTRIVQEVVANINAHTFLPNPSGAPSQINADQLKGETGREREHSPSSSSDIDEADKRRDSSQHSAAPWATGHGDSTNDLGQPSNVRIFFGSGNSMTSKIAYSIWRNIIPGLLTELVEGRMQTMHVEESRVSDRGGSPTHDHDDQPDSKPLSTMNTRRNSLPEAFVMIGSHGVARIQSAGNRRKTGVIGGTSDDDLVASQAAALASNQASQHQSNQQSKLLITEQLSAAGLTEDEFCLINRFFPNNPYLQFPESTKVAKLAPTEVARILSKVILNLLIANYHEFGPILLVLENIQWLDTMSWRVVDRLTRRMIGGVHILLTTRPASFSQSLKLIVQRTHTTHIKLDGLDQRDIEGLCCLRLKVASMPRSMAEMITKASNGNPLFVQELLLSLQQTSLAAAGGNNLLEEPTGADSTDTDSGSEMSTSKKRRPSMVVQRGRHGLKGGSNSDDSDSSNSNSTSLSNTMMLQRRNSTFHMKRNSIIQTNSGANGSNSSVSGPSGYSNSINALFSITASMQQIMTSRIDKLTPRQQDILKAAAVIGMSFSSRLVCIVCSHINPAIVDKELIRMDTMGFIVMPPLQSSNSAAAATVNNDGGLINEDRQGSFRHAVMQDVTYKLMSKADRSALHLKVAEALEKIENSREALRYLPHFTTLGLFMLPAWMEDQVVENQDLVQAGLVDEHGNILVEVDVNGEPILDENGFTIPLNQGLPDSNPTDGQSMPELTLQPRANNGRRMTRELSEQNVTTPPMTSADAPPAPLRKRSTGAGLNIRVPIDPPQPQPSPKSSLSPRQSSLGPIDQIGQPSQLPTLPSMDPAAGTAAPSPSPDPFQDNNDMIPDTSELVERANAAKELAYHFNMAGVALKALVYLDLASAIFLTMQEADESKKLMQMAISSAIILAPIKHIKLFTRAEESASEGTATPKQRGSANGLLSLLPAAVAGGVGSPSGSSTPLSSNGVTLSSMVTSSLQQQSISSSTQGSLRLCDALCLAKWERRLGESCRLLEEEDEAHTHLMTALKYLQVSLPSADTAVLNPQHAVNSTFLAEGSEGQFERSNFLTEVASVLLILSQCYYTSRPHEPLIGMHASFLCLQAAQKASHISMMAAAYADLLLGCLSLGDLELVNIYYELAHQLVENVRETPNSIDATSGEMAKLLSSLAAVNLSFGRWTLANKYWMEAYQLHRRHCDSFHLQECIQGLALLHRLSGHVSISSALYFRLQHIASHQQHATSPYFLPRAMLGLIENLVLSGANEVAMAQLKQLLLKGDELDEEIRIAAGGILNSARETKAEPSRRSSRLRREASTMSSRHRLTRQREPLPGGLQWISQPEVHTRWKSISLLLRWEAAPQPIDLGSTQAQELIAEALALLTSIVPDTKPAWNNIPRPAFHQLEAASALTQMLCGAYFERLRQAIQWERERKTRGRRLEKFQDPNSVSGSGLVSSSNDSKKTSRKEMDQLVASSLSNANLAFLHFRRLAEKLPIGKPRLLIWQGVLAYTPSRVGQSMSLWLEAMTLAKSLALPRDVGLACYWLSQIEVIPAPWYSCCLFMRVSKPAGAPNEEWRQNYRKEAIQVFSECGFGMRALGLVSTQINQYHHQIKPIQLNDAAASGGFHHDAGSRARVVGGHVEDDLLELEARFLPDHGHLALASGTPQDYEPDSPMLDRNSFLSVDISPEKGAHSRQPSGQIRTILSDPFQHSLGQAPRGSHLGIPTATSGGPDKQKRTRKGIAHITTSAPPPINQVDGRKTPASGPGPQDSSDTDSDPDSPSETRQPLPNGPRKLSSAQGGKYQVAGNYSEEEDSPKGGPIGTGSIEESRAQARRRRAERAGILSSSSNPASTKPSRRTSINQPSSTNRLAGPGHPTQSSSESDDDHIKSAAIVAATSPHNIQRGTPDSVVVGRSPATASATNTPGVSNGGSAGVSGDVSPLPALSPRDTLVPSSSESLLDGQTTVQLNDSLAPFPANRRHSVNLAALLNSNNHSNSLSNLFLSPSAGPKGLDAFRNEVAALNTNNSNPLTITRPPHTLTKDGNSPLLLPPSSGTSKSAQVSRAVTPAAVHRKMFTPNPNSGDSSTPSSDETMETPPANTTITTKDKPSPSDRQNLLVPGSLLSSVSAAPSRRNSLLKGSFGGNSTVVSSSHATPTGGPSHDAKSGVVVSTSFGSGMIFPHSNGPNHGLASMLNALDLDTIPIITSNLTDPNKLLPVHCFNFIPKQVLFRFLATTTPTNFLSSNVSDSFDAVVLAVNLNIDISLNNEIEQFQLLSNAYQIILSTVIQFDGRLLNAINHHTVLIMWETLPTATNGHAQRAAQQAGLGLADVCKRARACASAMKAKFIQSGNNPNATNNGFSFSINGLPMDDPTTQIAPVANFDHLRVNYVISAGHLIVVECPGVQQSVRQYLVLGHLIEQVLEAAVKNGVQPTSPGGVTHDSAMRTNHGMDYLGLVTNILGGTRNDELDSQVLSMPNIPSSINEEVITTNGLIPSVIPSSVNSVDDYTQRRTYSIDLGLHGMQSITEDPESSRGTARLESGVEKSMTVLPAVVGRGHQRKNSFLSPSRQRQPIRPGAILLEGSDEDPMIQAQRSMPKLTNIMILQKVGSFIDAHLLKKAFGLFIPRLHGSLVLANFDSPMSPPIKPSPQTALVTSEVCCLLAYFSFKSLDDITGQISLGLGGQTTWSTSTNQTHRAFTGSLNTLIQVLRYLLTLFPTSHMKLDSVGTGMRVLIVMEQSIMVLSCAIRLLSAFQDVKVHHQPHSHSATFSQPTSPNASDPIVTDEYPTSATNAYGGYSGGAPVSCCIGIGSGSAVLSGLSCTEGNNQWNIVGPAIDRAEAALQTSLLLHRQHELANSYAIADTPSPTNHTTGDGIEPLTRDSSTLPRAPSSTHHNFKSMDNSYRILLCDATYKYVSQFNTANSSVVVERVELKQPQTVTTSGNGGGWANVMEENNPNREVPGYDHTNDQTQPLSSTSTPSVISPLDHSANANRLHSPAFKAAAPTYRLIRFRHPAQYKLAQTSLCGRWKELQILMALLPTLDRIPRTHEGTCMYANSPIPSARNGSTRPNDSDESDSSLPPENKTTKPGAFVLLTGEAGVGKSHLMSAFKNLAARTVRERIFTVRLNAADQSTPWGCLRALVASILETEAKYDARLGTSGNTKTTLTTLFQQTMGNLSGQSAELLPYLACLNSLLPVNCVFAETRSSKALSSGDRAEFTLTLLTYLFVFLLEPRPFLLIVHNGEFIDSLSWVGIKRISLNFSKSFFLVSAGAISAMDRSTNAGPMLKNLNHYRSSAAAATSGTSASSTPESSQLVNDGPKSPHASSPSLGLSSPDSENVSNIISSMPSASLAEFAYTEISLKNLQTDEIPSVIMNYLGLVHIASSFIAFMIRQTQGHPQLLIHSLELMLTHGSLQDPKDTVVYSLDHIMFGFANAGALASAVSGLNGGSGVSPGATLVASNALNGGNDAAMNSTSASTLLAGDNGSNSSGNGMSSVLGLNPSGASDSGANRPAQVSMHELTLERINSLSSSQSLMLRVASIIGASFDSRILRAVHPANPVDSLVPRAAISGPSGATPRLSVLYLNGLQQSNAIAHVVGGLVNAVTIDQTDSTNNGPLRDSPFQRTPPATLLPTQLQELGFEQVLASDLAHLVALDLIQESGDADSTSNTTSPTNTSTPANHSDSTSYVFVSSAIRELVYGRMEKSERTRLHTLVARFYEREARDLSTIPIGRPITSGQPRMSGNGSSSSTTGLGVGNGSPAGSESSMLDDAVSLSRDNLLAYHWRQAGDQVKQFIYTLSSARKSLRMHANKEATQLYTQAIALRQTLNDQPATYKSIRTNSMDDDELDLVRNNSDHDLTDAQSLPNKPSVGSGLILDPLEVLHFELSSACRNLSLYSRSNKNLLETLVQLKINVLQPFVHAANQHMRGVQLVSHDGITISSAGSIAPIEMDRMEFLRQLDQLEEIDTSATAYDHGPYVHGQLVSPAHPAWLLAAKSFEKIAENCLRTGEALLGFHAIINAVKYYQTIEDHAIALENGGQMGSGPENSTSSNQHLMLHTNGNSLIGHIRSEVDISSQASAHGLLSVYCASFGFKAYQAKHMNHAKELFLSNPINLQPTPPQPSPANSDGMPPVEMVSSSSSSITSKNWNVRVTLSNYESMFLIGQSQLDEALNLLIDMQMGAADTFLGGHRSHRDLLFSIGLLFFLQGDYQQTMLALEDVLALARAHKDTGVESSCLNLLAFIHILCDSPYEALDVLSKSKSLHTHTQRKNEKNVLCHTLLALTNLRLSISPLTNSIGADSLKDTRNVVGVNVGVNSRAERNSSVSPAGTNSPDGVTLSSNLSIQRSLDSVYNAQDSIDVIWSYYSNRLPLLWHDCIEHMGLATYLMEVLAWIGSHLDVNRKEFESQPANPSTNNSTPREDTSGTFSSSNPTSTFAPLSEHESTQLRSLHATCLGRLKLVHSKLLSFEQRFPWAHALTSLVSGALIMLCVGQDDCIGNHPPPAPGMTSFVMGLERHYFLHDSGQGEDDLNPSPPQHPSTTTSALSIGSSKVPLHAALECWQSGMKLSTEHHMTHLLAHAHFLFGIYLRVQDPARRVHLQTARAIWNANGSQYYSNLAASALCHLSYFDLGLSLQHRLSPFTPYGHAILQLHAEKTAYFTLLTPASNSRQVPTKGILRHSQQNSLSSSELRMTSPTITKHVSIESTNKKDRKQVTTTGTVTTEIISINSSVTTPPLVRNPSSTTLHVTSSLLNSSGSGSSSNYLSGQVELTLQSQAVSPSTSTQPTPRRTGSASTSRKVAPQPTI